MVIWVGGNKMKYQMLAAVMAVSALQCGSEEDKTNVSPAISGKTA